MLGGAVRRVWIAALAWVVVVGGVACGGGDDEEATEPTASSTTAVPTTTLDEETRKEEAAKEAFLNYHRAVLEAASEPVTPGLPKLQHLMTNDQQRIVTRNLEDLDASGRAVRVGFESLSSHDIRRADLHADGSVLIVDCEIDDAIVYEVETGKVIDDDIATRLVEARMVYEGSTWKLALSRITNEWGGAGECSGRASPF
jgi:predicted lipid-binding transport protein (Tim44 family)